MRRADRLNWNSQSTKHSSVHSRSRTTRGAVSRSQHQPRCHWCIGCMLPRQVAHAVEQRRRGGEPSAFGRTRTHPPLQLLPESEERDVHTCTRTRTDATARSSSRSLTFFFCCFALESVAVRPWWQKRNKERVAHAAGTTSWGGRGQTQPSLAPSVGVRTETRYNPTANTHTRAHAQRETSKSNTDAHTIKNRGCGSSTSQHAYVARARERTVEKKGSLTKQESL